MTTRSTPGPGANGAAPGGALDLLDLAAVFAAGPGAAVVYAADAPRFTVLAASDALLAVSGRPREAIVGRALAEAFPTASPDAPGASGLASLSASLAAAVRTGAPQRMARQRYDLEGPDGAWEARYWDAVNIPVVGPDGRVRCVLHQTEDVTAQVRGEAALRASEARFRTVQDASPLGFAVHRPVREGGRPDGRVVDFTIPYVNDAGARIVGHPRARLLAGTVLGIWPGTGPEGVFADFVRVLETGEPFYREILYERDGLAAGLTLTVVRIGEGADAEIGVTFTDATARLRAERERDRLLAELGAERERLRALVLQMPTPVAFHEGPELRFSLVNDAYKRASGGGRDVTGLTPEEAFPELEGQGFYELLARVYATGEPWHGPETPVRFDRDGTGSQDTWFDLRYEPVRDAAGRVTGVLQLTVDVTAQVRARREVERLLAESERARADAEAARATADLARGRLEALLEHLPVGVSLAEAPSGQLLVSNAAVRAIWGLDTPAARVADYSALYVGFRPGPGPEADRQYASDQWPLARALAAGRAVTDEVIEILRPDGTRVLASVSAAPVRDAAGAVVGGVVMTQDVTERERLLAAERAARARTERLQALTAALAGARTLDDVAAVVVADMVVALGARTGALAGRDPDGGALVLLRTVGFPEPVAAGVRKQPLDFRSPLTECYRTGAPVWVESRSGPAGLDALYPPIAPVWDALGVGSAVFVPLIAGGEAVGVISFSFDGPRTFVPAERSFFSTLGQQAALAVERSRLFDAERAARTEAEAASRAKSEFLAVMSHELRTPLNAIGGYAELMEMGLRGPVSDQQREDLARIQRSQRALLGLINGVLNYARLETGAVTYDLADVRVAEAVAAAEVLVAPQLRAKGLGYEWVGCDPTLAVRADRDKLQQVLLNLLSNAIKFTNAGPGLPGRIEVSCDAPSDASADVARRGDGARVSIRVRDTGIGIPPEKLGAIFEPFVQVNASLTRTEEGTGLGLAISRDLARGMGGDLTVESEVGAGSTFVLLLPRA